jgi:hypothetical protein
MKRSTGTWTIALAAAALLALPAAGAAQTSASAPPSADSATPVTSPTDPTPTPTGTSPTASPQTPDPAGPPAQGRDQAQGANAARQHLTAARNALSELTQLPAAAQLTGETRNQVSQLISNFNELITTTTEWRAAYSRVDANLVALLGPDRDAALAEPSAAQPQDPAAVGTTGAADLDPEVRGKLVEFRKHLNEFERAAGGGRETATRASETDPTTASGSTSTGAPEGTPGTLPADTAGLPADPPQPEPRANANVDRAGDPAAQDEVLRHIDAIEALLGSQQPGTQGAPVGTTGAQPAGGLDAAKVELIRTHLNELRRLLHETR